MNEERATISVEVLNKVINALAAMPYSQVAQLIQEVQESVKLEGNTPPVMAVPDTEKEVS